MQTGKKQKEQTEKLTLMALFTALVAILSYFGGFIKIGGLASVSLTLIPVVIGAALHGPAAGAWLGAVSGVTFFATADAVFWFGLSIPGTVLTVMAKGMLAGASAGAVYRLLEKRNRYLAVSVSAIVCPVVNTGVFLSGCLLFFMDTVAGGAAAEGLPIGMYLLVAFVGLNFVVELIVNIILCPAVFRILNYRKRMSD